MSEEVIKRPKKDLTVAFLLSQFSVLNANIPGINLDTVKAQVNHGNYYLHEDEIASISEEQVRKLGDKFNADKFLDMLKYCGAVKAGKRPAFGGVRGERSVRINSLERALEVANSPEDAPLVAELMTQMLAIRSKINPLIDKKSECSIALKNKKAEEEKDNTVEKTENEDIS